jgi:hypothetical protein
MMHDARHAVLFLKYVASGRAYRRPYRRAARLQPYTGKGDADYASWKAHITNLARGQNVVMKLGGR